MSSNKQKLVEKWQRWKKRNKSFPLSVHPNGQWCKKVLGENDPQNSLAESARRA